jgi:hypothetical protein
MIQARPIISRPYSSEIEAEHYQDAADTPIERILRKITKMKLPAKGTSRDICVTSGE